MVPGRSHEDGSSAAAGCVAAQPAAGGAAGRVSAHPACGAAYGLRAAAGPAARPGRGPPSAGPRGGARRLAGSSRRAIPRRLHTGTTPWPPGSPGDTTGEPEGSRRKPLSPGRGRLLSLRDCTVASALRSHPGNWAQLRNPDSDFRPADVPLRRAQAERTSSLKPCDGQSSVWPKTPKPEGLPRDAARKGACPLQMGQELGLDMRGRSWMETRPCSCRNPLIKCVS